MGKNIKMENYEERKKELTQDALRLKIKHSDRVYQLAIELDQDIQIINGKIAKINEEEKKEKETVKQSETI